jgi:predicted RNA-binding Zn-ribbon protein involved in translation (DUF1610 family)
MDQAPNWTCSQCGKLIENAALEPRQPCPHCGSIARTAHESVHETITSNVYLKTHSKHREGGRKVVREVYEGDDLHRNTGKWNLLRRVIDRMNDWYDEVIRDRHTNEIIHEKHEPLSEHRTSNKKDSKS